MLTWQLLLAGPLGLVGLLTVRAGWLCRRGRLPLTDPRHADRAKVAAVPLTVAGLIAVLGAVGAAAQPTVPAMVTVTAIGWAGAVGLAVATRRLVAPGGGASAHPTCASCPLTGSARAACCATGAR